MIEIGQTRVFSDWFGKLKDEEIRSRIRARLRRVSIGNFGDVKSVGEGVSELRLDYGPGYRLYFTRRGNTFVLLLCGGDKRSQAADILKAKQLAREL
jgi:putative addiction module killer protein